MVNNKINRAEFQFHRWSNNYLRLYVYFECWRAEWKFSRLIFFHVLVEIIFASQDYFKQANVQKRDP